MTCSVMGGHAVIAKPNSVLFLKVLNSLFPVLTMSLTIVYENVFCFGQFVHSSVPQKAKFWQKLYLVFYS